MKLEDFKNPKIDAEKDLERLKRIINILKRKHFGDRIGNRNRQNKEIKDDENEHIS